MVHSLFLEAEELGTVGAATAAPVLYTENTKVSSVDLTMPQRELFVHSHDCIGVYENEASFICVFALRILNRLVQTETCTAKYSVVGLCAERLKPRSRAAGVPRPAPLVFSA
jgi:hypothetical protein